MMRTPALALLLALLLFGCGREEKNKEAVSARDGNGTRPVAFAVNPEGFGGIAWGTPLADLPQLVPATGVEAGAESGAGEALYGRQDETASLAGVPVQRVEYRFRDGHFARAVVYLGDEAQQGEAMKQALFADYGAVGPFLAASPVTPEEGGSYKEYRWQFERGAVALFLDTAGKENLLVFAADAAGLIGGSPATAKGME